MRSLIKAAVALCLWWVVGACGSDATPHINGDPETGKLGESQCPLSPDRRCPDNCAALEAAPLDMERDCIQPAVIVDCSVSHILIPESSACLVQLATGTIHLAGPGIKGLPGWRECTQTENDRASAAPHCPD